MGFWDYGREGFLYGIDIFVEWGVRTGFTVWVGWDVFVCGKKGKGGKGERGVSTFIVN